MCVLVSSPEALNRREINQGKWTYPIAIRNFRRKLPRKVEV